jgi:hypothetical protein
MEVTAFNFVDSLYDRSFSIQGIDHGKLGKIFDFVISVDL